MIFGFHGSETKNLEDVMTARHLTVSRSTYLSDFEHV